MKLMKKLLIISCLYFSNSYSNELLKLVESLQFIKLKDIILSKEYSKKDLEACKTAIENIVNQKSKTTPWYKNFRFLSRVGLGTASTIYFGNMLVQVGKKFIAFEDERWHGRREPSFLDVITLFFKANTAIGITQLFVLPLFYNVLPEDVLVSGFGVFGGLGVFFKGLGSLRLIQDKDYNNALAIKSLLKYR